jgi:hypothetical protein
VHGSRGATLALRDGKRGLIVKCWPAAIRAIGKHGTVSTAGRSIAKSWDLLTGRLLIAFAISGVAPGSSKIFAACMDTAPRASGELAIELAITVDALPIFEEARPAFRRQVNPDFLRAIGCDDFPHPPIRVVGGRR